jgi:hypothetical protein
MLSHLSRDTRPTASLPEQPAHSVLSPAVAVAGFCTGLAPCSFGIPAWPPQLLAFCRASSFINAF